MKPWWERWPGLLEREVEAFRALGHEFRRDEREWASGRLVVEGTMPLADGRPVRLRVVYPDTYPDTRFTVFAPDEDLPRHQNPLDRNLCVFPRHSSNWMPYFVAAEILRDRLDKIFKPSSATDDPQGEPVTAFLQYWNSGCVIVPEAALAIPSGVAGGYVKLRVSDEWLTALCERPSRQRAATGLALLEEVHGELEPVATADEPLLKRSLRPPSRTVTAPWIRVPSGAAPRITDVQSAVEKLLKTKAENWTRKLRFDKFRLDFAAVLVEEEVRLNERGQGWVFGVNAWNTPAERAGFVFVRGLRYGPTIRAERIPELHPVRTQTASIIGLGSLGSPIAQELARAQVRELRIADFDFVDPAGGVRWITELDAPGAPKTAAVRDLLTRNYPYTSVEEFQLMVGDASPRKPEEREGAVLRRWLDGASVVIDASAEDNVSYVVSRLADERRVPQVYLWSIDAYGGVVARVVPGQTGCFWCLQRHLEDRLIKPPPAPSQERPRVQPAGCADPTFTGDFPSLAPLAFHAARVVLGLMCRGHKNGYPDYRDDVFVLALRSPDGSLITPSWTGYPLPKHPKCRQCSDSESTSRPSSST